MNIRNAEIPNKVENPFLRAYRRGGKDLWTCVRAIDNRHSRLNLGGKIEKFVDRATKLYYEPAAFAIQRQAIAGNQVAYGCFAALKRCHDGRSEIASENWSDYPKILRPRPAESCEAKAAQLVIDWLLDDLIPKKPWDCLASWLSTIGNPSLAAKLLRPDSANFYALVFGSGKQRRRRVFSAMRQQKYRRRKNHPISRSLTRILGAPAKRTRAVKAKK